MNAKNGCIHNVLMSRYLEIRVMWNLIVYVVGRTVMVGIVWEEGLKLRIGLRVIRMNAL